MKEMQFKVPQNVQREDTIIGPLTLKQMAILGVGGGIAYAVYVSLASVYFIEVWLVPVALISIVTLAVAFLKIYNMPFYVFLMRMLEYYLLPRKRVWMKGADNPLYVPDTSAAKPDKKLINKKQAKAEQDLSELVKMLDTKGRATVGKDVTKK